MKSVLALDLSKDSTGYAFGYPNETPRSGSVRFGLPQHSEGEVGGKALVWMTKELPLIAGYMPEVVAIEAAWESHGNHSAHTSGVLLGLQFLMQSVAFLKTRSPAIMVKVASARKTFTGRGAYPKNEGKPAVQAECIRRGWLTHETMQADRADALCVWAFAASQQLPELAFHKSKKAA